MAEKVKRKRPVRYARLIKDNGKMKKMLLQELCRTAFDSMDNYFTLTEENGEFKVLAKDLRDVDLGNISEISNGKNGVKFKLYSKEKAIERLGSYLGLFRDRTEEDCEDLEAIRKLTDPDEENGE